MVEQLPGVFVHVAAMADRVDSEFCVGECEDHTVLADRVAAISLEFVNELLARLRQEDNVPIEILDVDRLNGEEVDSKLIDLATELKASIVTTDYNLNRVAQIQGIRVLNVNELATSLRPVVLPGEGMLIRIVQEGKEPGQGVGFLDDGTMVVVDGGDRFLHRDLDILVTRVLQTAAGCIIFAQPKRG